MSLSDLLHKDEPAFRQKLLKQLTALNIEDLPLGALAQASGVFRQESLQFDVLAIAASQAYIQVRLGLFFEEISALCPCSGDAPETEQRYCELELTVCAKQDKFHFSLLP